MMISKLFKRARLYRATFQHLKVIQVFPTIMRFYSKKKGKGKGEEDDEPVGPPPDLNFQKSLTPVYSIGVHS
jgi:hypothetical protein